MNIRKNLPDPKTIVGAVVGGSTIGLLDSAGTLIGIVESSAARGPLGAGNELIRVR